MARIVIIAGLNYGDEKVKYVIDITHPEYFGDILKKIDRSILDELKNRGIPLSWIRKVILIPEGRLE